MVPTKFPTTIIILPSTSTIPPTPPTSSPTATTVLPSTTTTLATSTIPPLLLQLLFQQWATTAVQNSKCNYTELNVLTSFKESSKCTKYQSS